MTTIVTTESDKALRCAIGVVQAFRQIDSSMPASYAHCLLVVATRPDCTVSEVAETLGVQRPTVSRILLELGRRSRPGGPGYGLVEAHSGESDLRKRNHRLTPEGHKLIARIVKTQLALNV